MCYNNNRNKGADKPTKQKKEFKFMRNFLIVIATILLALLSLGITFGLVIGAYYLICLGLGLTFNWYLAIGIYIIFILVSGIFKISIKNS